MNDEPSSSASAQPPRPTITIEDEIREPTDAELATRRKQNKDAFNKKRRDLLDDVLRNFDILVYAELSAIYYMDCYFFRFFLRAIVQLIFLTPKSGLLPEPPTNRPYIGAILGANILCIILHAFGSNPSAGEATRGYLHGGLAMDFIGQKGPTSKLHLLCLDFAVLVLQIAHLSAHTLKQKLSNDNPTLVLTATSGVQSIDDEERGVRHSSEVRQQEEVEMLSLNPSAEEATTTQEPGIPDASTAHDVLLASTTLLRTDAHIFDAFNSGQIVVADLNLPRTVHEQFLAYQKSATDEARRADSRRMLSERLAGLRSLHWAR